MAMYIGEYLISQTIARITVLGFQEADVNIVIGLIGMDLFHYIWTVLHETQIHFKLFSYFQQHALCDRQSVPKRRQTTINIGSVTFQKGEGLNLLMPTVR